MNITLSAVIRNVFLNETKKFILSITSPKCVKFKLLGKEKGFSRISPLFLKEFTMIRKNGNVKERNATIKNI
jgi:hypothetical protein